MTGSTVSKCRRSHYVYYLVEVLRVLIHIIYFIESIRQISIRECPCSHFSFLDGHHINMAEPPRAKINQELHLSVSTVL